MESLVNIDPLLRRCLNELASKVLRKTTTLCYNRVINIQVGVTCRRSGNTICVNLSPMFQVTLVRDDYNGKEVLVLDAEDLLVECADLLNRVVRGDRVDEEEAFTSAQVLLPQGTGGGRQLVSHEKL